MADATNTSDWYQYQAASAPIEDDLRHDDLEFNPAIEPQSAKAWLNLLEESEKAFEPWNNHCDRIDKLYGNLERLSVNARDKQFQMFWANCEVLRPAIYARPPVPVVTPKFKDRRPVYQAASEILERCIIVNFDYAYINELMLAVRDDLALINRGVAWVRYASGGKTPSSTAGGSKGKGPYDHEKVCLDFKHRRDFVHSISRCWNEVSWVAAASYLTRPEARARFQPHSGDCYQDAEYRVDKDAKDVGGTDNRERAKFWEIWHKGENRVVWVAKGCEDILDQSDPHLHLQGFFPCPKPAYGTCQRGSLVPVPDVMQYRDQLDEVNLLTSRIHALSDALEAKGFYPAGGAELGDAIQAAIKIKTPGRLLVPIANWAAFGGSKEVIVWLPIAEIAQTISSCVELRKQIIDDIYQIMGLSDIMRGSTDPRETLGSQELKTQYGSSRIHDKQYELVRLARDLVCLTAEIICQKFDQVTVVEMSQTQLPTQAMLAQQVQGMQLQLQQQTQQMRMMAQSPQAQQMLQTQPNQAQALLAQAQQALATGQAAITHAMAQPTIEQVFTFLQDNRIRTFVLDIETDSTIMPNDASEKQARAEFLQMLAPLLQQLAQMIAAEPETAEFCGEILKFAAAPYRVSRSLDGAIDDLVEQMKAKAGAPKGDPAADTNKTALQIEQLKQDRQKERDQADIALKTQELQLRDAQEKAKIQSNERIKLIELQSRKQDDAAKAGQLNMQAMRDRETHQMDMVAKQADMRANAQKTAMMQAQAIAKQNDMAARANERRAALQMRATPPQGPPL